jgi:hypothetical protein
MPEIRVNTRDGYFDFASAFNAVENAYPDVRIGVAEAPADRFSAAKFAVVTLDGARQFVYVNPMTLQITGSQSIFTVQRFFREFHEAFFGLYGVGKLLVCLFSIPLFLSMISAFVFYKRWWKRFFQLRIGKTNVSLWSSLHKLAGLWSLWFVFLMTLTGGWYLFEEVRYKFGDEKFTLVDAYPLAVKQLRVPTLKSQRSNPIARDIFILSDKAIISWCVTERTNCSSIPTRGRLFSANRLKTSVPIGVGRIRQILFISGHSLAWPAKLPGVYSVW